MSEHHELMDGRLHLYKRENSRHWQCSAFLNGRNWRRTTKEESLAHAKDIAEDWYLELRGKARAGILKTGRTFAESATHFLDEYVTLIRDERSPKYIKGYEEKIKLHLNPFFGTKVLSEVTPGLVQEYRVHRAKMVTPRGTSPARVTLHNEIVVLRQVLKFAHRKRWLDHVPDLSNPYKASGKVGHRAWFSPTEYKQLYEATRCMAGAKTNHKFHKWAHQQLHDFVLFMANTGLRPDEAARLEFRDVAIVKDDTTKETILEIEVRGKRGVGWCKSTSSAVQPFKRLQGRLRPSRYPQGKREPVKLGPVEWVKTTPNDRLFPTRQAPTLNKILTDEKLNLKKDREGKVRSAYSLRHTYICFRLMEGADVYQIAKNCRTSVEMIEEHYARHIKNAIDASAINVRRGTVSKERKRQTLKEVIDG